VVGRPPDGLGDTDELDDTDRDTEADGDTDALGEIEAEIDADGDPAADALKATITAAHFAEDAFVHAQLCVVPRTPVSTRLSASPGM